MEVRRSGNFGFVDPGNGSLYSFDISGRGKGWEPSSIMLNHNRNTCFTRKMSVAGYDIVPMGDNNDMPGEVMRLLDRFYAGEGILGKIAGLQWGDGPRFYEDAIDDTDNRFYKKWVLAPDIESDMSSWDYRICMHRCLVDLTHMQGFFIKFVRNRAPRIGGRGKLLKLEHIPYQRARLLYPPLGKMIRKALSWEISLSRILNIWRGIPCLIRQILSDIRCRPDITTSIPSVRILLVPRVF